MKSPPPLQKITNEQVHDDLQSGWCYRRKENFTFRYDALEDELA